MEPDVVEIAPPLVPFPPRTRKPRKSGVPEVIDVEQYEFRNGVVSNNNNNNNNLADKKNKGKAKQDYYDHNPLSQFDNDDMMEIDGFPTSVQVSKTQSGSKATANWNPFLANPYAPPQSWDFYSGLAVPHQNNQTVHSPQTPDVVMMPGPPSRAFTFDGSASSSRRSRRVAAEVVCSPQEVFLKNFKRFDTVEDFSDHHYASKGKASKQHSKPWVKKVQSDWKILENDLPETIFVRACESRMDLLRAVIIGPEGTPYHDGLFFFDIQFPDTYPAVPPKVYYHSGGLRINPNLYNCGKVCLSLLGTWAGNAREKWLPKESTMLQLLVSIQALILNQKPYFNEPGWAGSAGTVSGEAHSKVYSENVFLLSLNTMVYSMRRPPKHFEEFVRSHYFVRAHDIVKACNAYRDGAPLGSMVKGGVQDVEEASQSGSQKFRTDVPKHMKPVVDEFVKLGVKDLQLNAPPQSNANTASSNANKRSRASR
ncbi:unnamed protein product [Microthlaspi erraticum]|uniref:E2 ubiquitin-conjugating enzyme n=1 Tax=Microthlaspi erraticum TaxID=1685480 RepID=A0A6D2HE42_9BRAS|nr:unnamed protein product [Microthlaspi erraticum]